MTLPRAYAPFAPVLARLSEPLRHLLEGQLAQFEPIAPLLQREEMAPAGMFEGLGGLAHRGEISHIVQSELLLRSEAPLEFLRRLAEGETLYHEKQYADPGARRAYRAMVSVGPGLLGHGRIVALATIFFLARVAAARDAAFHWCFLPRDDGAVWFDEVSVNTIKRFLRAASFREMTAADQRAADEIWATLVPGAPPRHDWAIGAMAAVRPAEHALAIALLPPRIGEPRAAELAVRRAGRESMRAAIRFPDDRQCVAALRNPFDHVRPATAPAERLGEAVPPMAGWAPEMLSIASQQARLVRTARGLLVIADATKQGIGGRYFVPLANGVELVGVRLVDGILSILIHHVVDGREVLRFSQHDVAAARRPHLLARARAVPSEHLFKKRPLYAIPLLNRHDGAEFYSASGQAYHLSFADDHQEVGFAPLYKAARTLHATGRWRVTLAERDHAPVLRIVKDRRTELDDYRLPPGTNPEQFRGLIYATGERRLAYSLRAGEWVLPSRVWQEEDHVLPVAAHEQPLVIQRNQDAHLIARLWSDARYGGDGMVRTIRHENGRNVQTGAPLDLGADAAVMARLMPADDGIWGVTVDAAGAPATLLSYRRNKREQRVTTRRFDLAEAEVEAIRLDPEVRDAAD